MNRVNSPKRAVILVAGDAVVYLFSLILTLTIRYGEFPTRELLGSHIPSFSILFALFALVGFSAGIYDKQSSFLRGGVQWLLLKAQVANIFIGIAYFYLAPVTIAPKANLAIFFVVSTALLFVWRAIMFPTLSASKPQVAILIGDGEDIDDLYEEVNANNRYGITFKQKINTKISPNDPSISGEVIRQTIENSIRDTNAQVIVADLRDKTAEAVIPFLYSQVFSGKQVIDASRLYEAIFDRIPLSLVGEKWLIEHAAAALGSRRTFDFFKRVMDITVAGFVGTVSLILYPFVCLAIRSEDRGPIFISQKRTGKGGKWIKVTKFRSMTGDDAGAYGMNGGRTEHRVTRVGKVIRFTRIDELPQLWSVIKGDQSLIGPRPELPSLVEVYEKEIPYYHIRHLIKPGLSGWAQIYHRAHPHHAVAVSDTREKLSYDLYYVKNRSFILDLRIALQTAKALLSRQGV